MAGLIELFGYENPRRAEYDRLVSLEKTGSTTDLPFEFTAGWERALGDSDSFRQP